MLPRFLCFAAACLALTSCLKEGSNTCSISQLEPVLTAIGPKTVAVNQTASYTLSFVPLSTCGTFQNFLEQTGPVANTTVVGVRVDYSSCDCPASNLPATVTYRFTPTKAGTYYLNFISASSAFVRDTLVVQ